MKTVWITGGTSGIGLAVAKRLLSEGHQILLTGEQPEVVPALSQTFGDRVAYLPWDVTDPSKFDLVREQLSAFAPHLDLVLAGAGVCEFTRVDRFQSQTFNHVMQVNYQGVLNTLEVALPLLEKAPKRPLFAVLASLVSWRPLEDGAAYGASKAAIRYVMQGLYRGLAEQGIDATLLQPGFVDTPMTSSARMRRPFLMTPEQAADRILRACERRPIEYCFPKRLHWLLRLEQALPLAWRLPKAKKAARRAAAS